MEDRTVTTIGAKTAKFPKKPETDRKIPDILSPRNLFPSCRRPDALAKTEESAVVVAKYSADHLQSTYCTIEGQPQKQCHYPWQAGQWLSIVQPACGERPVPLTHLGVGTLSSNSLFMQSFGGLWAPMGPTPGP